MENNVVTLDTAKKLKAAGFEQDLAQWRFDNHGKLYGDLMSAEFFAAPTAQEIADRLPKVQDWHTLTLAAADDGYAASYEGFVGDMLSSRMNCLAPTMAEALAALWIKLNE